MPEEKYKRMRGVTKFFSHEKGYGFIKRQTKADLDIFFTAKELERAKIDKVSENDVLEFDHIPIQGKGGKAINLKKIDK